MDCLIISADEIRYNLIKRNIKPSPEFDQLVFATRNKLLSLGGSLSNNIILDQKITNERMQLVKQILHKNAPSPYRIKRILLTAPEDVLRMRVASRPQSPGKYLGTLEELETTLIKTEKFEKRRFDLVFDSSLVGPEQILSEIKRHIVQ